MVRANLELPETPKLSGSEGLRIDSERRTQRITSGGKTSNAAEVQRSGQGAEVEQTEVQPCFRGAEVQAFRGAGLDSMIYYYKCSKWKWKH